MVSLLRKTEDVNEEIAAAYLILRESFRVFCAPGPIDYTEIYYGN